ncbi:ABC transporter permease [Streptomyces sp. S3(2020)]|uniref:ABC transporter permease n=1 Tax=Streptomyces sp. S3(2020) TaxID=2732044 RepID=UPI0014881911|nr:ABC transporter permease [Streptomyces sp. S3(2020)]NNN35633.1 ABC transporter permease [Streptomyces sp. S3(2020)]
MDHIRWLLGRVATAALTLFGVSVLIFAAVRAMPGSYTDLVLGPLASRADKAEAAARFGLDRPVTEQYLYWLRNAVQGDFGTSLAARTPVAAEFGDRLPVTVTLTVLALVLTVAVGVPLGVYTGTRDGGGRGGVAGRLVSALGMSLPEFVLGSLVVFLFTRYSLGLTVGTYVPWSTDPLGSISSLLLPACVLAVFCVAATARTTRDAVLGVRVEPHIAAAVARGEPKGFIVRHHVLRNASVPVLTLVATLSAYLLGGAVIVERLFNVPGLGSYLVDGLDRRDYAVIQAGVLLAATVFITTNLLVDLVSGLIDPRISTMGKGAAA